MLLRLPPLDYDNRRLPPIFDEQPDRYNDPRHLTQLFDGYPHPNDMNAAPRGSSTTPHPNKDLALPARNQVCPTPLSYSPYSPFLILSTYYFIYVHVI